MDKGSNLLFQRRQQGEEGRGQTRLFDSAVKIRDFLQQQFQGLELQGVKRRRTDSQGSGSLSGV